MSNNLIRIMALIILLQVVSQMMACGALLAAAHDRGIAAQDAWITIENDGVQVTYPRPRKKPPTLPQICEDYIEDGTEKWINCMGVEYK